MSSAVSSVISHQLPGGYTIIETIYQGSRTVVYRALKTDTQQSVIIKALSQAYPSFDELVQFRHQYAVTKNLPIPGIVRPLSLETYGNGYALVMEEVGGISLECYAQEQSLSLIEILGIAVQLADILHPLQQQRVIHKDIKPANILIHPESKRVHLIDFSIASLLPKETQMIQSPESLEGTLAYLAPEQTGRMNRAIDYRTDFYALGVTLYQLLTGQLPFASDDPMELIHCHMAQLPVAASQVNPTVPSMVAAMVSKLMAKNAEDRYQSALGLKQDLEQCLIQWKEKGEITEFELGQRDLCDHFLIPEKLYGRESEVMALLEAYSRASAGQPEIMLVAGSSGIGKTAVINEVHKPVVRQQGYFIKGKYDQFNRNVPFSAFVQAFRHLVDQLLSESDVALETWKAQILEALGENAQVMIDLIPTLEDILGPQQPAPELSGTAAQNRFNLLFHRFIQVFATAAHPLVLFVDDLQWADSASLNLIQVLMGETQSQHLLLLGAYRDNEVFPAHPLMLSLDEMAKAQVAIHTLTLSPLKSESLNHLVADTLHVLPPVAQPLTELVMQKTEGNPFFATQFLKTLHQDQLITFDDIAGHWQCDIVRVQDAALTDDVVDLMAQQLQKLPDTTQEMLKLAACIGAQFDLATLAIVSEHSQAEVATALWQALQAGMVLPQSELYKFYVEKSDVNSSVTPSQSHETLSYRFLHDRIQQAAYSLIPSDQQQRVHLVIGQRLLKQPSEPDQSSNIFAIVHHLNLAQELIHDPDERWQLIRLNLQVGQTARAGTAYQAAFDYLTTGLNLLPSDGWQQQYGLTLSLYQEGAISASLVGEFDTLNQWTTVALEQAQTFPEQVPFYESQIQALVAQQQLPEAIQLGIATLEKLGASFSEHPQPADFPKGIEAIALQIGDRAIEDLLMLPVMKDPQSLAILRVLWRLSAVLMMAAPQLMPFCMFKAVELSISTGNSVLSAPAYVTYGMILCGAVGDVPTGYRFGQLGLQIIEQHDGRALQAKTLVRFNAGIRHWQEPLRDTLGSLTQGYQLALDVGDFESAAICAEVFGYHSYFAGQELTQLEKDLKVYSQGIESLKQQTMLYWNESYRQHVLNLLGHSNEPCALIGEAYDEAITLPKQQAYKDGFGLAMVHLLKAIACYLFERHAQAIDLLSNTAHFYPSFAPFAAAPAFHFYTGLAHLAVMPASSHASTDASNVAMPESVEQSYARLQQYARYAPMNHQHKVELIAAERYRILNQRHDAADAYDRAILGAKENNYTQEEALANELAAKFYLNCGKQKVAAGYMQEAYYCYSHWGAKAKVADLETRYPELLRPILQSSVSSGDVLTTLMTIAAPTTSAHTSTCYSSSNSFHQTFDFASILKASQALSGTIQLDALMRQLTQIILKNSGADRCVLILPITQDNWQVRAITTAESTQLCMQPLVNNPNVPTKLIQYVKNTQEVVVIDDLVTDLPVIGQYLNQHQPKSVLCLPILNQGHLIGILYLNNHLTSGSFTEEHILTLNFLCTQAAISLENARLYQQEQKKSQEIAQKELEYRSIFESVNDGLLINDLATGKIVAVNPKMYQMHGYAQSEWLALQPSDFIHPSYLHEFGKFMEKLHRGEEFYTEGKHIRKDGSTFAVEVKSVPFIYQGKPHGLSIVRDISVRKRAEEAVLKKSRDLKEALDNLQNAQLKLVQGEKMSALGGLVAGVAHEINNPVGCILGNVGATQGYIKDLLGLLDLYTERFPEPGSEIADELEEVDLDYVREDLPNLIRAMKDSGDRIKSISKSLRTFSRADTENKQIFNLHEGLDSTLLILRHRLKANEARPAIEVKTDYGNLPEVNCFPGQLNQVFMNILANAIDALDEASQHRSFADIKANPNRITVCTQLNDQQVEISISDNGPGIPETVKAKIFDHLFTTKEVGKGTGLGLAIARQIIVEGHGGTINVKSELGTGTEFCLSIPL